MGALSCLVMSRRNGRAKYRRFGAKFAKRLKSWMEKGNPNCVAYDALLDAEKSSIRGQIAQAHKHYEAAALLAGRRGLIHVQALSNELNAYSYFDDCNKESGTYRLKEAINLYVYFHCFCCCPFRFLSPCLL